MINLYISWYPEEDKSRADELIKCLNNNVNFFDRIFVLTEKGTKIKQNPKWEEVIELPVTQRPTFRTFFNVVNHTSDPSDINVIANSDIYFDESPECNIQQNECYALTRYEKGGVFLNRIDSQDTWIFRGHIKLPGFCSFHMGVPGCDNRIAWELSAVGYTVSNPSLTIKTHHLHSNPTEHSRHIVIEPPYLKIVPSQL